MSANSPLVKTSHMIKPRDVKLCFSPQWKDTTKLYRKGMNKGNS